MRRRHERPHLGDFGRYADLCRPLKDSSETFCTPALTDMGQRGMVRQSFVQTEADKPANSDVNLSPRVSTGGHEQSQEESLQASTGLQLPDQCRVDQARRIELRYFLA